MNPYFLPVIDLFIFNILFLEYLHLEILNEIFLLKLDFPCGIQERLLYCFLEWFKIRLFLEIWKDFKQFGLVFFTVSSFLLEPNTLRKTKHLIFKRLEVNERKKHVNSVTIHLLKSLQFVFEIGQEHLNCLLRERLLKLAFNVFLHNENILFVNLFIFMLIFFLVIEQTVVLFQKHHRIVNEFLRSDQGCYRVENTHIWVILRFHD